MGATSALRTVRNRNLFTLLLPRLKLPSLLRFGLLMFGLLLFALQSTQAYGADDPAFDYLKSRQQRSISIEGKNLSVLVRPWEGKQQKGAVIIFADTGFGPDAPGLVAYLRDGLSPIGWASISMTPPQNPPHPSFTTAPEQVTQAGDKQLASNQGQPLATHSKEDWQKHVDAQLKFVEQSLGELAQIGAAYPGKRILVAMDRSAGLVIKLLADGLIAPPNLLVVINPYSESPEFNALLPGLLSTLTVPVLDIQAPDANRVSLASAPIRQATSSMKDALGYRQLLLALNMTEPDAWAESLTAIRGYAASLKRGGRSANQRKNQIASQTSSAASQEDGVKTEGSAAENESGPASFMPEGMTPPVLPQSGEASVDEASMSEAGMGEASVNEAGVGEASTKQNQQENQPSADSGADASTASNTDASPQASQESPASEPKAGDPTGKKTP